MYNLSIVNCKMLESSTISKLIPYIISSLESRINKEPEAIDLIIKKDKPSRSTVMKDITNNKNTKEVANKKVKKSTDWKKSPDDIVKVNIIENFENIPLKLHNKILKAVVSQLSQIKGMFK